MTRSNYYKTSNDLAINSHNPYPFLPNENENNNPFKSILNNNKKVRFSDVQENYTNHSTDLNLSYKTQQYSNTSDPEVWGPAFWFSLHNGAIKYPIDPSPLWKERMKHFILGIPVMVPCEKCSDHATAYLEQNYNQLDNIVSSRSNLFQFFWKFHNYVNERLNKPQISLEYAYKLYNGQVSVTKLEY